MSTTVENQAIARTLKAKDMTAKEIAEKMNEQKYTTVGGSKISEGYIYNLLATKPGSKRKMQRKSATTRAYTKRSDTAPQDFASDDVELVKYIAKSNFRPESKIRYINQIFQR